MGSVWDAAAESRRHVGFEAGVQDAVISYSAPPAHLPAADAFIDRSLRSGSKVLDKMSKQTTRLPAHFYGPRPPTCTEYMYM